MRSTTAEVRRRRLDLRADPLDVLRCFRGRDRLVALLGSWHHGEALVAFDPVALADDPFDVEVPATSDHGFGGGWIGAWGYRLGRRLEPVPEPGVRPVPQPDHRIGFYDRVLRRTDGVWWLETLGRDDDADVLAALTDLESPDPARPHTVGTFTMTPGPDGHRAAVAAALEHVAAGDVFQVNVCARLEAAFAGEPLDLFCAGVQRLAPAYAAFVDAPEGAVASFSPELFLRRTGTEVLTSPIKGTAALSTDPAELVASAKDRAENVMIVDLMRNDLGRVCAPGTVRVPSLVRAERHAVWHLVSDVVGHLEPGVDDGGLLRATFPPGSVTGAPKVRAMQVAAALEATARETYTGAIGHVSVGAGLEMNVAIRTFEIAGDRVWLGVGGGVVTDSTPEGEYAECLVKARPLVEAVGGTLDLRAEPEPPEPGRTVEPAVTAGHVDVARGLYDTLLVEDGRAVDVEVHVARLDASVRAVFGESVRAGLEEAVHRRAAGLDGRHRLRLDAVPRPDGVQVSLRTAPLEATPASWTLEPQVVAGGQGAHKWADRRALEHRGGGDVLVVDTDGSVLETGRASVFVVRDDGVHTPPLDGRILPGTARARVIDRLLAEGIPVLQHRLDLAGLADASEVFAANALRGVVPVTEVVGVGTWPVGPLATRLRSPDPAPPRASGPVPVGRDVLRPTRRSEPPNRHAQRGLGRAGARVLFVDNYDSFVYNLVQYVRELGAVAEVVRNDALTVDDLLDRAAEATHVVVSPGPGAPADAGVSVELVRRLDPAVPLLGVCLGHQVIAEAHGARVVRAPSVVHGKPSLVHHDGTGVLAGLPSPLTCARYHSLVVDEATLPDDLVVTARTAGGVVMGLRHRGRPLEGVQMHPESILTTRGHDMLASFLRT